MPPSSDWNSNGQQNLNNIEYKEPNLGAILNPERRPNTKANGQKECKENQAPMHPIPQDLIIFHSFSNGNQFSRYYIDNCRKVNIITIILQVFENEYVVVDCYYEVR